MSRQLLVFQSNDKKFKVTIPDDAKITYGPFSPPSGKEGGYGSRPEKAAGTLRIYQGSKENIVACFSQVVSFRDLSLGFAEEVAKEEGSTIWKDDEKGYVRSSAVAQYREWVEPDHVALPAAATRKNGSRKRSRKARN